MGIGQVSGGGRRAVFLDRDGVLNRPVVRNGRPHPPATLGELEILGDAANALRALKEAGFLLLGVTNQPDVARGTQRREVVEEINAAIRAALPLDDMLVCYHDDADGCPCRKPGPGLLKEAAERHRIDLGASFLVGDRWRDVEAGHAAGCTVVLIDYGYSERAAAGPPPDCTVRSLSEAGAWILSRDAQGGRR